MAGIERFEDIEAWQAARELTQRVYAITKDAPFSKDYGLCNQIQTAGTSVMANIAEGFDGGSNREFIKFLGYALRSATEVQSHLYVALDQRYIQERDFESLYGLAVKTKNLIRGFIRYLRSERGTQNLER